MNEKKAEYVISGAWDHPKLGTDNQHRALTKIAKEYGYKSMAQFVAAFKGKIYYNPDGSITKLTAHTFFHYKRGYQLKRLN